jgi:hypothetical protein
MVKDIRELVQDETRRPVLIADCVQLIDAEVRSKSGLGGIAVRAAYALVKTFKPKMMENTVDALLDDFAEVLQTHYQRYQEEGSTGALEGYFAARADDIAEGLLTVTDGRARRSSAKTIVKAYEKLRPKAKVHVGQAAPALGALLARHVA